MQRGTLSRALLAAALLLAVFAAASWWATDPSPAVPLEAYTRQGRDTGATVLRRDLVTAHPPGSPVAPLLQRLRGLGLGCAPAPDGQAATLCSARLRGYGREVTKVEVLFGMAGDRVSTLDATISTQTQP